MGIAGGTPYEKSVASSETLDNQLTNAGHCFLGIRYIEIHAVLFRSWHDVSIRCRT